jgi:hypothetical protein
MQMEAAMRKMKITATAAELAEIFGVTEKTIYVWTARGLMEKSSRGKYLLKESVRNFAEYVRVLAEGGNFHVWFFDHCEGRFADARTRREALRLEEADDG